MQAHIAAGLETAPPQRWRHGQERAPDPMTRAPHQVASGVADAVEHTRSGNLVLEAVERFREDYVLGVLGGHDPEARGHSSARDFHAPMIARCNAVSAHQAIEAMLGREVTALLIAFAIDDLSYAAMDRRFSPAPSADGRKGMAVVIKTVLTILPGAYVAYDRYQRRDAGANKRRAELRAAAAGEWEE